MDLAEGWVLKFSTLAFRDKGQEIQKLIPPLFVQEG